MLVDQTPVDLVADEHLARWTELNPCEASMGGLVRYRAGDHLGQLGQLGLINGQLGFLRASFDNIPKPTPDDLDTIAARLAKMRSAVANLRDGVATPPRYNASAAAAAASVRR
ncbi:MAG: hypothetical protein ABIR68_00905 [Ilumatobacteraceae bacterium]